MAKSALSANGRQWIESYHSPDESRLTLFLRIAGTTPSLRRSSSDILTVYIDTRKGLWDKEPRLLIDRLLAECPHFFRGMPNRGGITETKMKTMMGNLLKFHINQSEHKHTKPSMRKRRAA